MFNVVLERNNRIRQVVKRDICEFTNITKDHITGTILK